MPTRKFPVELIRDEWEIPWSNDVVEDEIVEHSRWEVHHDAVFLAPDDGKHYRISYSVGATERQDYGIWEYVDFVEGVEVELQAVMVNEWVKVGE